MIALEVNSISDSLKAEILKINKFSGVDVQIYIPKSETQTYGVIGPIDITVDMEDLLSMHCVTENGSEIVALNRLNKFINGSKTPSASVRVTFSGDKMPTFLMLDFLKYQVRDYNRPPLRCYNCQLFGHTASGCTRRRTCVNCSGAHSVENCPSNSEAKCSNCNGPHKASSSECPTFKKYATIVKQNSEKKGNTSNNSTNRTPNNNNLVVTNFDFHRTQGSYLDTNNNEPSQKSFSEAVKGNTTTDTNEEILNEMKNMQSTIIREINKTIQEKQNELKNMITKEIDEKISNNNIILAKFVKEIFSCGRNDEKAISRIIYQLLGDTVGDSVVNPKHKPTSKTKMKNK